MALAIQARFDSAVVALVKIRSDKARREASIVGADDIQAGEIILNGVAGMVALNLKGSNYRPITLSWDLLKTTCMSAWSTHVNAEGYEAFIGDPFVSCVTAGKETGAFFEAWPEEPNYERSTLRISMY